LSPNYWSDNFAVWRFIAAAVTLSTDGVIAKGKD